MTDSEPSNLKQELEKLAAQVVRECSSGEVSLPDKIDALKTLTSVYVALEKFPGDDEVGDGEFNFAKGITQEGKKHGLQTGR